MANWLVIGASSFTGSHFCQYLRNKGEEVSEEHLRTFPAHWNNNDYVVNFSALNVVAPSWRYPEKYLRVNIEYISTVLEFLRHQPIKRYVHISTPEVYGSTYGRVKEDHPYNPSTPYAASRAAAEMLLKCYGNQYNFPYVITRSCNVYGPGQQLYRLIPRVIASISNNHAFPLEGNGHSVRSFLHVRDVCRAIEMVALSGVNGTAYNVSTPLSFSIAGLVETICVMMCKNPKDVIEPAPERPGKDMAYNLDDTKIRRLGWNDEVFIDDGIKEVISWMQDNWETVKDWPTEYRL